MSSIKVIESGVIFDNPMPQLRSRQGYWPKLVQLPDGELLASYVVGEAFESVDLTTMLARSSDGGKTWTQQGPICVRESLGRPTSDSFKITGLGDGRVVALGYRFERPNEDLPIGNPETGGLLHSDIVLTVSHDLGRTWQSPDVIPNSFGGPVEASAPIEVLANGDWVAPIANFADWSGQCKSGFHGRLLRSEDKGQTWDDSTITMEFPERRVPIWEQRLTEMDPGTLLVIDWTEDIDNNKSMPNSYAISTDNGRTFGVPESTGILGQASNVHYLGDGRVLSLHCKRRDTDRPGIYGYVVDLSECKWDIVHEEVVWEPAILTADKHLVAAFGFCKFGQPSVIRSAAGDHLMVHWVIEEGQGKIVWNRLEIDV